MGFTTVSEVTSFPFNHPAPIHDVDAAHARLRSHQSSLDSINSRVDSNERRIDRMEKRIDDQSALLADLSATAKATQSEVKLNGTTSRHTAERIEAMIDHLNQHIRFETEQEHEQTLKIEKLHRTIIRATTALVVVGLVIAAFVKQGGAIELMKMVIGG